MIPAARPHALAYSRFKVQYPDESKLNIRKSLSAEHRDNWDDFLPTKCFCPFIKPAVTGPD